MHYFSLVYLQVVYALGEVRQIDHGITVNRFTDWSTWPKALQMSALAASWELAGRLMCRISFTGLGKIMGH